MTQLIQPFKIKGKIVSISDTIQVRENFKKRVIVLSYILNGNNGFSKECFVSAEAFQGLCELLNNYNINEIVEVECIVEGRRYEKDGNVNYFNVIKLDRIYKQSSNNQPQNDYHNTSVPNNVQSSVQPPKGSDDDLPF